MLKYKLTDQNHRTHKGFQWTPGVPAETSGNGELCSDGWLHYYHTPELAVLLNPIHANIHDPVLWECEAEGEHLDDHGLKGGCTKLTLLRQVSAPEYSTEQRVEFGIRCALAVYKDDGFISWAEKWLNGTDRAVKTTWGAEAAAWAAEAAARAAEAAARAAWAAEAAARAAEAAARAARADLSFNLAAIASSCLSGPAAR